MGPFAVILPAAGRSSRFGDPRHKKVFAELGGRAVWLRAVEPFLNRGDVAQILLAIAPEDRELFESRFRPSVVFMNIRVLEGGDERHETVAKALELVDRSCEFVAVHDAARPCVPQSLIDAVFHATREYGAALPGLPVTDTLKRVGADGRAIETVPRAELVAVQTPQAFRRDWLDEAYARRHALGAAITDDAQLVEALGHPVRVVDGSRWNLKITTPDDLQLAESILPFLEAITPRGPTHPYADEKLAWDGPPLKPGDLFKD
jgi:2-C-methyl-D-erythritol 4-phosphate cytidylyltransferase